MGSYSLQEKVRGLLFTDLISNTENIPQPVSVAGGFTSPSVLHDMAVVRVGLFSVSAEGLHNPNNQLC